MKTISLSIVAAICLFAFSISTPAPARPIPHAPIVTMVTTKGTILIKLFPQDAPISCRNFVKLVKEGFYNGHTFFRSDPHPDKLIQGGSPTDNNTGQTSWHIKGEFPHNGVKNPLTHVAGAVAMARASDPNSAGSQFYICVDPVHELDGSYAVFGQVIKGLDVANNIVPGDKMLKVTVKQ